METKTNAMRILTQKKIKYQEHFYSPEITVGEEVAKILNQNPNDVYKTLVTVGNDKRNYVFVVPVNKNLDLKKAAKVVKVKSIEMIKQKELFSLTGYIHGGCSPVGMKKLFTTVFDSSIEGKDKICCSGGRVGCQIEVNPKEVINLVKGITADIVVGENND